MNLRNCRLFPMEFFIQIIHYDVPYNQDENAIYTIEVNYKSSQKEKKWQLTRTYNEFEILHNILIKKHHKTPYLPCRLLLQLRDEEKLARSKLMETYLNICLKRQEMLNSLELRLFLNIEENLNIFLNTPINAYNFDFDDYPINLDYWPKSRNLFVLKSRVLLEEENNIKKIFNKFSNYFTKKSEENMGNIILMKEKFNKDLDYKICSKLDFKNTPTVLNTNENLNLIVIGFKNGLIEMYELKDNLNFEITHSFESHENSVTKLLISHKQNLMISSCQNNFIIVSELTKNKKIGFTKQMMSLKNLITIFFFYEKKDLLFIGDNQGFMHAYRILSKEEGYLKLTLTQLMNQENVPITNFFISKNEKYLYISFQNSTIIVYDVGENFSSKPSFVNCWELDFNCYKSFISDIEKCFVNSLGEGMISFCDTEKPDNLFYFFVHKGKIYDFFLEEKEKLILSVGKDKKLKITCYFENLNIDNFPKKRYISKFCENIENYIIPSNEVFVEKQTVKIDKIKNAQQKNQKDDDSSDEDDDLAGWA